ncbi:AfsR/SARP family transcriptional regulator [Krasilnikoviella flava]|uniref:Predicted ATPase n=1 Tax=Krasilnikoviella flava TaxID=526729 RepID=A0A1T5M2G6_9MICO|nr:BTAD domain-containing putative transcriptional regulator [Krasilnikoviella flava]SKC82442.1 Predicted ATPase [Krasilnikoviella flava]
MRDALDLAAGADDSPGPAGAPAVRVLGPVRVAGPGGELRPPRGARAAALVVLLALGGPRGVSSTAIVDRLWQESLPADPRAALQNLVSRLRAVAGRHVVRATETGYALGVVSDLDLVREGLTAARHELVSGDPGAASATTERILGLWDGAPGGDLDGGGFAAVARELAAAAERWRDGLRVVRRDAAEATGQHAVVAEIAVADLAADPTDEDAARALMGALGGLGRPAEALRVFTRLRSVLVRELGSEPGPATVALYDELAAVGAPGPDGHGVPVAWPGSDAVVPADGVPAAGTTRGLRTYATPLLGRDADVAAVRDALDMARLVTVLGPGGLGKTRLAQEVARRAAARTPFVVVVELVGVRDDDDVVLALADALGIVPGAGSLRLAERLQAGDLASQVAARLRDADALVVLDNCEHVVEGAARWAATLLDASPRLRVLATSRTPLLLEGEVAYAPAPLGSDPAEADGGPAVRLFVERARAVRPDALLDHQAVARLCERLDGLPLAIELAAARVRTLSVAEVDARLDERFALLRVRDRSVPDRHRTLEAVLDWSWNLLSAGQQALWRRAAVLPDGFSAEAARALVPAASGWQVDDDVAALVLQSLVRVEEADGAARYRMVETVREFGLLRLAASREEVATDDAVLGWSTTVARRCASHLLTPGQREAVAELAREQENLLFAVRRAVDRGRPDAVVHGFVALLGSWTSRGAEERVVGLAPVVLDSLAGWQVPEDHADATAIALVVIAGASVFGAPERAARPLARLRRLLRTSRSVGSRTRDLAGLVLARSPEEIAEVLARLQRSDDGYTSLLAHMFEAQQRENDGELARAVELAGTAHEVARRLEDPAATAMTAMVVASFMTEQGDAAAVAGWVAAARDGLVAIGADEMQRQVQWIELSAALTLEDLSAAESTVAGMADALEGSRGAQATESVAVLELGRGEVAWLRGDRDAALEHFSRSVATFGAGQPPGDAAPWFLMAASATLVRRVQAGAADDGGLVQRIVEVGRRVRGAGRGFVDRPVLATSSVGVAYWACLGDGRAGRRDPDRVAAGAELLALAGRLGARQDLPALRLIDLRGSVADSLGGTDAAVVRAAEERAGALARDELVPRAEELLARLAGEAGQELGGGPAQAFFM